MLNETSLKKEPYIWQVNAATILGRGRAHVMRVTVWCLVIKELDIDFTHIFPDGVNWTISLAHKNKMRNYPSVKEIIEGNYYELLLQDRIYTQEMLERGKSLYQSFRGGMA